MKILLKHALQRRYSTCYYSLASFFEISLRNNKIRRRHYYYNTPWACSTIASFSSRSAQQQQHRRRGGGGGGGGGSKSSSLPWGPSEDVLTVAILGPPNAGKSTLYNRLLDKEVNQTYQLRSDKKKKQKRRSSLAKAATKKASNAYRGGDAIVSSIPGTTRDRREGVGWLPGGGGGGDSNQEEASEEEDDNIGTYFWMMDTAGVDGERLETLMKKKQENSPDDRAVMRLMMEQALHAARHADLILVLFDARNVGVTTDVLEICRWIRRESRAAHSKLETTNESPKVLLLANKLENEHHWDYEGSHVLHHLEEAATGGFEVWPISAMHGDGMSDLAALIHDLTQEKKERMRQNHLLDKGDERHRDSDDEDNVGDGEEIEQSEENDQVLRMAILGRPNVGKSTLMNALLQQQRVITGPMPGLTRDAISVAWSWSGHRVRLVDTAGIFRRRKRRQAAAEEDAKDDNVEDETALLDMAVQDAARAMKVADVAVLVLDAGTGLLQRQELAIADAVIKEGRALVVAANKMDLVLESGYDKDDFASDVRSQLEARFPMLRRVPIVPMSSLTEEGVEELMPVVVRARDRWARTISTSQLNRWLREVLDGQPPPISSSSSGGPRKTLKIKYIMQTKGRPPTFLLFCNHGLASDVPAGYLRYLTRHFQDSFEMYGMDVRLAIKDGAAKEGNPFHKAGKKKRGGSGLGGRQARQTRAIQRLKQTGSAKTQRRKKKRFG